MAGNKSDYAHAKNGRYRNIVLKSILFYVRQFSYQKHKNKILLSVKQWLAFAEYTSMFLLDHSDSYISLIIQKVLEFGSS